MFLYLLNHNHNNHEMKKITSVMLFIFVLVQFGCTKDDDLIVKYENLKTLEIGDYEMEIPESFIFKEGTGFDSYIGTITGDGIKINFDYGSWSLPPQNWDPEKYEFKHETFDSIERYILVPENPELKAGIHIRDLNNIQNGNYVSLNMVAANLSREQQILVVKIFESVYFKE